MPTKEDKQREYYRVIQNCMKVLFDIKREPGINRNILASRLNVAPRTISRYIDILRNCGFDIRYSFKRREYYIIGGGCDEESGTAEYKAKVC